MKYRTVIELICEASSKEDAVNVAGEYLKGDIEYGVDMRCQTLSIFTHKMKKYAASCAILLFAFSTLFLKIASLDDKAEVATLVSGKSHDVYTVVPALKTKDEVEFKEEWDEKKEEVVMDFLKD